MDNKISDEATKDKRRKQIVKGIQAGYDELIKMTEPILLRGAI